MWLKSRLVLLADGNEIDINKKEEEEEEYVKNLMIYFNDWALRK